MALHPALITVGKRTGRRTYVPEPSPHRDSTNDNQDEIREQNHWDTDMDGEYEGPLGDISTADEDMDKDREHEGPLGDNLTADEDETPENYTEMYPGAARVYGKGETLMDIFDRDEFAEHRVDNFFYPFASRQEWEMASFLIRSNMSMVRINDFLGLSMVSPWMP